MRNKASLAGMWVLVMAAVLAIALAGSVEARLCSLRCWKPDPKCAAFSFLIFAHSSLMVLSLSASSPKGNLPYLPVLYVIWFMEWGLVQIPSLAFPACHTTFVIIFLRFFMCFPICGLCKHITILYLSLWSVMLFMLLCLAVLQNTSVLSPVLLLVAFLCYRNTGYFLSIFDWRCGGTGAWAGPVLAPAVLGLGCIPLL